ncbi:PREDICTED: uncharacterized protein LOC102026009 [Chinchilla lanigera]|uniref:uncharacterized protein LOC102026009 n=1 Tax=Chinchilla lanigera TaxID=34839 RepID=UPI00038EF265|nr:PREDICTED: uncharacterized protein LOC102026009 [Chinchilla lanigera]
MRPQRSRGQSAEDFLGLCKSLALALSEMGIVAGLQRSRDMIQYILRGSLATVLRINSSTSPLSHIDVTAVNPSKTIKPFESVPEASGSLEAWRNDQCCLPRSNRVRHTLTPAHCLCISGKGTKSNRLHPFTWTSLETHTILLYECQACEYPDPSKSFKLTPHSQAATFTLSTWSLPAGPGITSSPPSPGLPSPPVYSLDLTPGFHGPGNQGFQEADLEEDHVGSSVRSAVSMSHCWS